jgi:hypothetical protein
MSDTPDQETPAKPASHEEPVLLRLQPLLTLLIALMAIALTIWEGAETRRHNRLSVQPRLDAAIESGRDSAGEYVRMAIESTGLGPAVIRAFRVYLDGALQDTMTAGMNPWRNVTEAFSTGRTSFSAHGLPTGYYLPPGREHLLFEARRHTAGDGPALAGVPQRLALQVCYCSVYDTECDEIVLTTDRGKVPSCIR